jgi:HKD family nuclease
MTYKLINNLSSAENHSTRLKQLFSESDTVILTSPFLMLDFADFFGEINFSQLEKFHLITTLSPKSFDQIKKISSLSTLVDFPDIRDQKVNCQISLNNKLHGKIYIFKKSDKYISAIISSANFTESGLSRNHEWGVEISDKDEIKNLEKSILDSIEFSNLTIDEIHRMQKAANEFLERQPQSEARDIDLNLTDFLSSSDWAAQLDNTINYWLKPIGVTGDPIEEGNPFDTVNAGKGDLNFSKLRPTGVKPNDILIAYGVGTTKILSVYRVTSYPEYVTPEDIQKVNWYERWPWYVNGENLTPTFGGSWWSHNLYINGLKEQFLNAHKGGEITAVGGKTLGGLNFGKDKLKLSHDFAKFIINKVIEINDKK